MNQERLEYSRHIWTVIGHQACTKEADTKIASYLSMVAIERGDDVVITPTTWKEERLKRGLIKRHYPPKVAPMDDLTPATPVALEEPVQPDLTLTVDPHGFDSLLVALKDHETAVRKNTEATWALEGRLRRIGVVSPEVASENGVLP